MTDKTQQIASKADVDLTIDTEAIVKILTGFIANCTEKTSSKKAIIGLSGGLDSSVVGCLAAKALGAGKVLGVILPYRLSAKESGQDAENIAQILGIQIERVDVSPVADAYFERYPDTDETRRGNMLARQRMCVLYDLSAREHGLVIGTSNKSELLLGYGTIFGDLACAVNPVGDLYKTQIRQLAEYLDIPEYIRSKTPTADLFVGQTDEVDLGFTYEEVDKFLFLWVDKKKSESELEDYGFKPEYIKRVITRVRRNHFKRIPPLIAKLSTGTIGHEFQYTWDWSTIS